MKNNKKIILEEIMSLERTIEKYQYHYKKKYGDLAEYFIKEIYKAVNKFKTKRKEVLLGSFLKTISKWETEIKNIDDMGSIVNYIEDYGKLISKPLKSFGIKIAVPNQFNTKKDFYKYVDDALKKMEIVEEKGNLEEIEKYFEKIYEDKNWIVFFIDKDQEDYLVKLFHNDEDYYGVADKLDADDELFYDNDIQSSWCVANRGFGHEQSYFNNYMDHGRLLLFFNKRGNVKRTSSEKFINVHIKNHQYVTIGKIVGETQNLINKTSKYRDDIIETFEEKIGNYVVKNSDKYSKSVREFFKTFDSMEINIKNYFNKYGIDINKRVIGQPIKIIESPKDNLLKDEKISKFINDNKIVFITDYLLEIVYIKKISATKDGLEIGKIKQNKLEQSERGNRESIIEYLFSATGGIEDVDISKLYNMSYPMLIWKELMFIIEPATINRIKQYFFEDVSKDDSLYKNFDFEKLATVSDKITELEKVTKTRFCIDKTTETIIIHENNFLIARNIQLTIDSPEKHNTIVKIINDLEKEGIAFNKMIVTLDRAKSSDSVLIKFDRMSSKHIKKIDIGHEYLKDNGGLPEDISLSVSNIDEVVVWGGSKVNMNKSSVDKFIFYQREGISGFIQNLTCNRLLVIFKNTLIVSNVKVKEKILFSKSIRHNQSPALILRHLDKQTFEKFKKIENFEKIYNKKWSEIDYE